MSAVQTVPQIEKVHRFKKPEEIALEGQVEGRCNICVQVPVLKPLPDFIGQSEVAMQRKLTIDEKVQKARGAAGTKRGLGVLYGDVVEASFGSAALFNARARALDDEID
eukprot:11893960-Karenia_brevis.AAC.1